MQYTTILHDVRKALGLTMIEYAVIDSVYNISRSVKYTGGVNRTYLADFLGVSRQSIVAHINKGIELGLLTEDGNGVTEKLCEIYIQGDKFFDSSVKIFDSKCKNIGHNIYNNNNFSTKNSPHKEKKEEVKTNLSSLSFKGMIDLWNEFGEGDAEWFKFSSKETTLSFIRAKEIYEKKIQKFFTKRQLIDGLEQYKEDIKKRNQMSDYAKHRFTLPIFLKQTNGLEKFSSMGRIKNSAYDLGEEEDE